MGFRIRVSRRGCGFAALGTQLLVDATLFPEERKHDTYIYIHTQNGLHGFTHDRGDNQLYRNSRPAQLLNPKLSRCGMLCDEDSRKSKANAELGLVTARLIS